MPLLQSLAVLVVLSSATVVSAAEGLPELAARIRVAEATFQDCEFTTKERMEMLLKPDGDRDDGRYRERIVTCRAVNQGLQFWVSRHTGGHTFYQKTSGNLAHWMFDGQMSRESDPSLGTKTIKSGRVRGIHPLTPHREASALAPPFLPDVPLSLNIRGLDAIRTARPEAIGSYQLDPNVRWELHYRGTDVISGLSMERVSIEIIHGSGTSEICDLWFVPARHYFVGRVEWRKGSDPVLPYSQTNVTQWKQFAKDIWYPAEQVGRVFNLPLQDPPLKVEKPPADWVEADLLKRVTLTMEIKSLEPQYPPEFFRALDPSDGSTPYGFTHRADSGSDKLGRELPNVLIAWWLPGFIGILCFAAGVLTTRRWLS